MQYRTEIDGLRALAVLPVIFFHAGFEIFQGGFVGVDVFFVISGYLITGIILGELQNGSFSFARFYERRARRILPALFLVMAVCVPFAWSWLSPTDFKAFLQSAASVALFSSNVFFWHESGYFATAADLKPLLHTWSLGVEEHYYIVFPLVLIALRRLGQALVVPTLVLLFVISLALSEWGARAWPDGAFFLLHTRFWELLAGSLTAMALHRRATPQTSTALHQLGAMAGVSLIFVGVFCFSEETRFPGVHAIVPVAGTVLVIACARHDNWCGRILSWQPLVTIGLISYSAYLWHQPLFAFYRVRSMAAPTPMDLAPLALAALVLAYLTWRFVENPFRNRSAIPTQTIFRGAVVGSIVFVAAGVVGRVQQGFPERFPPDLARLANFKIDNASQRDNACSPSQATDAREGECTLGNAQRIVGVLLGDSHAEMLWQPLHAQLSEQGIGLLSRTGGACPPLRGLYRVDLDLADRCTVFNETTWSRLQAHPEWKTIVLSARWTIYLERSHYDNGEGGHEAGKPVVLGVVQYGRRIHQPEEARRSLLLKRYTDGIQALLATGRQVILVYPTPEVGWEIPTFYWKSRMFNGLPESGTITHSHAAFSERNRAVITALDAVGEHPNLVRIRPDHLLCNAGGSGRCLAVERGQLLYADDDHLSNLGAARVVTPLIQALRTGGRNRGESGAP